MKRAALVRFRRTAALVLAAAGLAAAGCGSKAAGKEGHAQAAPAPEAAARPTPDTTPVEALRTPAGLILKPGEAPTAVIPGPPTPTPAPPAKPAS